MKNTVFISHATPADNTFAVWLATKLELCGYNVWVDINNLSPSVDFWNTIEQTIRNETVKFVFVASAASIDPSRDGVQKELAVADKVRRQSPNFIIPVRVDDINFNDFPVEILRLNAIDFYNNWAKGLDALLKYFNDENVPKLDTNPGSQYYLDRWYTSQALIRSQTTDNTDEYCSNLFSVELPPSVYIYRSEDVAVLLRERHIPMKVNKKATITFACNKCISEWVGKEVDFIPLDTKNVLQDCVSPHTYFGETVSNLSRDVTSIINWTIGEMFYQHKMRRYRPTSEKRSRSVYFFPYGTKSKRSTNSRLKALSGIYKTTKRWHFGLSGYFTKYPTSGIIIKWHLIFTDGTGQTLSEAAQIAARRSKGRLMYNRQWKELQQASMFYLSSGTQNIFCTTCCEENAMYISSQPERFVSDKNYIDPSIYKQMNGGNDE